MLKTNEKNRKFQQGNRRYKEEPNGNFRTENTTETKTSMDGLTGKWRGQGKESLNLKTEQWKLPNLDLI